MAAGHNQRPLQCLTDIFDILDDELQDDRDESEYERDFDFDYIRTYVDDEEMVQDDSLEHTHTVTMLHDVQRTRTCLLI